MSYHHKETHPLISLPEAGNTGKPRLGFLGVGWIGKNRMESLLKSNLAEITDISDISEKNISEASRMVSEASVILHPEELFLRELDALVIATPTALHARHSIEALERGMAVFCQKPLGRNAEEAARIIEAARKADRLLGVDLSYRFTSFSILHDLIHSGELGDVYAVDLVFHNAYGPGKKWFYEPDLSGGGCVIDLGVHLIDLALWSLDFPEISSVRSNLFSKGKPVKSVRNQVEDFALARIVTIGGTVIRLACSWNLPAGQDVVIQTTFYGTRGGACFRNVNGSFYDFIAERFLGTQRQILAAPPDDWGGRAAVRWLEQLTADPGFSPETEQYLQTARVLDQIYRRNES